MQRRFGVRLRAHLAAVTVPADAFHLLIIMKKRTFKVLALIALLCSCWSLFETGSAQSKVDFVRDIQPILQTNCVSCHGPQKAQAQLRLDEKGSALTMIQPGNAKASRLLQRVLGEGSEPRMPQGSESLKPAQIELLRRWINEGATWPDNPQSAIRNQVIGRLSRRSARLCLRSRTQLG